MPWSQNGFGAGTDNSVAGGAGGFEAIPQPVTGTPPFNPFAPYLAPIPEWQGQFGSESFTYLSEGGNFFTINNPGRSA
jgi:hypothetical protein